MLDIIPPQYRLLAVVGVVLAAGCAGFAGGWSVQGWRMSGDLADQKLEHTEAVIKARRAERDSVAAVLSEERALRDDIEGIANAQRERAASAAADVAGLAGERDRLRHDLRRAIASGTCPAGAAAANAAGGLARPAAGLVSGAGVDVMLDESADALAILAPALDAARDKHLACVAVYNAARERLRRYAEQGRALQPP